MGNAHAGAVGARPEVDLVDVAVGDRWADLAVASMSLDWNYGEGFQDAFFAAYGIDPDPVRLAYYRSLWHLGRKPPRAPTRS